MEAKVIFIAVLFLALIFIRLRAEYKKRGHTTLATLLKKITGFEIHHLHFGLIVALLMSLWIYFLGINIINVIGLSIGISFILDEVAPAIFYLETNETNFYYTKRSLIISIMLHLITSAIVYFLF